MKLTKKKKIRDFFMDRKTIWHRDIFIDAHKIFRLLTRTTTEYQQNSDENNPKCIHHF